MDAKRVKIPRTLKALGLAIFFVLSCCVDGYRGSAIGLLIVAVALPALLKKED